MSGRMKAFGLAAAALLVFLILGAIAGSILQLGPVERWILRGVMTVLGLVAAFVVYRVAAARGAAADAEAPSDEVSEALDEAARRLAASRLESLPNMPMVVVLGPSGGAKTTAVARSGLDLELLTGEVFHGDTVAPTKGANVWYGRGMVVVEAAGALLQDEGRWARLARRLQPSRLRAAVGGKAQAPRLAVVCLSCEDLLRPGAAEAVPDTARLLRRRLQELAQRFGVRVPVYVLLTKADRLPYFADYVRNMTDAEAGQVLGVTLPVPPAGAGGAYAHTMADAITRTFSTLVDSLARKRLQQLSRESREEVKAGIYEFPRELAKLPRIVSEFLVELCRPSQLAVSPFLRGYYFTGVRAVVRSDPGTGPGPQASRGAPAGATMVFDAAVRAAAAPAPGAGRKVPQWLFLEPFFRRVVLQDEVARSVTSGGHGVNLLRRSLLAAAAAVALLLCFGLTVSYRGNREMAREARSALEQVRDVTRLQAGLPAVTEVRNLDALRGRLQRVAGYERGGRPWRLRWGLYTGGALWPPLQRAYFDRFDRLLGGEARAAVNGYLRRLPDVPDESSDYDGAYDALKAHLVTTSHAAQSTGDFLGPALLSHWQRGRAADAEITDLAAAQFAFYGDELALGNPYALRPEDATVERVREYLSRFQGPDRLYRALVADASRQAPAIRFNDQYPGSAQVIRVTEVVPGAYTAAGWEAIQRSLSDVETLFSREEWVTGSASIGQADIGRVEQTLRARYNREYVEHWRRFLDGATIAGFGGAADAAGKMGLLAGNQSPLLQLFRLAAVHTAVDSVAIAPAFQPLHAITPPDITDRFVSEANKPYMDALGQLQAALEAAASSAGPMRQGALVQAQGAIGQGRGAARQLAQSFRIDGPARDIGTRVRQLMETPLERTEALVGYLPAAEVNEHGRRFCAAFAPLGRKFPFAAGSGVDATLDEVNAVLKPGESALSALYDQALRDLVVAQGSDFAARVGSTPTPTPTFLRFFNRANAVARALYRPDGSGPTFDFALRLEPTATLPDITVSIDGQVHQFTRTRPAQQTFRWDGQRAQNASIRGRVDGREITLVEAPAGTWALFRLLEQADWRPLGANRYQVRWPIRGQQITLEGQILLSGGVPVMDTRYLSQLNCVPTIANR